MAAAMDGLDALVFSGGVGERAPTLRARVVAHLGHLGLAIDPSTNTAGDPDRDVSGAGAHGHVLVIEAREDLEIAREVRTLLTETGGNEP